ncbi:hypothetical protein ElyMa_001502200 [Elysia marginata]|uniref:Uncharacterized protein n=1 Tax=Elysia marginata TaxID=1093978 RepID=A0AAV4J7M5_9GAST|nr:hypothetical protein ElyMa_001502200 [Elysia marginata]
MRFSPVALLSLIIIACAATDERTVDKRFLLDSVKNFLGDIWNKLSGKFVKLNVTQVNEITNSSVKATKGMISEDLYNDILKARRIAIWNSNSRGVLALSQLVAKVRDILGPSLDKLSDTALADIIYVIELESKYAQRQRLTEFLKVLSLATPLLPSIYKIPEHWAKQRQMDREMHAAYQAFVRMLRD